MDEVSSNTTNPAGLASTEKLFNELEKTNENFQKTDMINYMSSNNLIT